VTDGDLMRVKTDFWGAMVFHVLVRGEATFCQDSANAYVLENEIGVVWAGDPVCFPSLPKECVCAFFLQVLRMASVAVYGIARGMVAGVTRPVAVSFAVWGIASAHGVVRVYSGIRQMVNGGGRPTLACNSRGWDVECGRARSVVDAERRVWRPGDGENGRDVCEISNGQDLGFCDVWCACASLDAAMASG